MTSSSSAHPEIHQGFPASTAPVLMRGRRGGGGQHQGFFVS
jgi:hypothetical protein